MFAQICESIIEHAPLLPRARMRSKGLCDRSWRLYNYIYIVYKSALLFGTNILSPKILTFRGLF